MTGYDGARDAILLFVRAPEMGRVKTRLAESVGAEAALRVYRRLAEVAVTAARGLGDSASIRVCYTPAAQRDAVAAWLGRDLAYLPQSEGDLGERMADAFRAAFAAGHAHVIIVGSDLPALTAELLGAAFDLLRSHRAVLGPARDGGYWLLGLRAPAPGLFTDMPWSTGAVATLTVERLRALGIEPAFLPELTDVDAVADLPDHWLADAQE